MIFSKFLKIAVPVSCILLLCSCGKANDTQTDSGTPKVNENSVSTTVEKVQINLTDYFHSECTGNDTVGYASNYGVHLNQMIVDHPAAFGLPEPYVEDSASEAVLNDLLQNINIDSLEKPFNYSNGDKVKIIWNDQYKALNDKYNVEFVPGISEFTVSGLTELKEFDPFDSIQVSFIEIEGKVLCNITGNATGTECVLDRDDFNMGDTVKISIVSMNKNETIEEFYAYNGFKPTCTEKEFKAE